MDDSSIFMTSLVPLKLSMGNDTLWTNPKPFSASYCRPVHFSFVKEGEAIMDGEIKALITSEYNGNKVSHQLMMTMINTKICTYLSEARCLAKPTEMNRLDSITSKTVSTGLYEFALSLLHARIESIESLLHLIIQTRF